MLIPLMLLLFINFIDFWSLSGFLHFTHNLLTNLCDKTNNRLEDSKYGSIPISLNLVIAFTALFVCTVESTRCPVKLA